MVSFFFKPHEKGFVDEVGGTWIFFSNAVLRRLAAVQKVSLLFKCAKALIKTIEVYALLRANYKSLLLKCL